MIPYLDPSEFYRKHQKDLDNIISSGLQKGQYINTACNESFLNKFSKYIGVGHSHGVGSGTDALLIALESLNIQQGSEVIIPNNTFFGVMECVLRIGCKPIFCKYQYDDLTLDIDDLSKKVNKNTAAVIAVHSYGMPCDMGELLSLKKEHNFFLIEDCSHAHGAMFGECKVGSFGDIAIFSMNPTKILGGISDGGIISTNSAVLIEKTKIISNHGRNNKGNHTYIGRLSRLSNINAIYLSYKLDYLDDLIEIRRNNREKYLGELKELEWIDFQHEPNYKHSSFCNFIIKTKFAYKLQEFLALEGIQTRIHYPYLLDNYNISTNGYCNNKGPIPGVLSLPIAEHLSRKDIYHVISKIIAFKKTIG